MTEILNKILDDQTQTERLSDEQSGPETKKPNYTLRRIAALSGITFAALGISTAANLAKEGVDRLIAPIEYSDTTDTYIVQENEGLDAITSQVKGVHTVDFSLVKNHIRTMPENIDALSDNVIQINETFVIPAEVKKR